MNKNAIFQGIFVFLAAGFGSLAVVAGDGITSPEVLQAVAAGFAAVVALFRASPLTPKA